LQTGEYTEGEAVTVTGLLAGDATKYGFFVVAPEGGAWRGAWVYTGGDLTQEGVLVAGDDVTVTGTYIEYDYSGNANGLTQTELDITATEDGAVVLNSSGNTVPAPTSLSTADLADTEIAEAFENTLVRVESVTVTNVAPDNYGNWIVDGSQYIGTHWTSAPDALADGDTFDAIQGVITDHYGESKIMPRGEADLEGWVSGQ